MNNFKADFIIIGAGIAGASAAYELSGEGTVLLLEREKWLAYHSSGRSAAVYMQTYGNRTVRGLTKGSLEFYSNPPADFSESPLLRSRGAVFLSTNEQNELIQQHYNDMKDYIEDLKLLNQDEISELIPIMNKDIFKAGIYEKSAMDMDANEIHQSYIRGMQRKGGRLITDCEVNSIAKKDSMWHVETTMGEFSAPVIVNAAGAWSDVVAKLAKIKPIGLEAKKRTVLFVGMDGQDISNWPYVGDISETFYFKPDAGRLFVSPCDEIPITPCDAKPNELDVAVAVNTLEIATNLVVNDIESSMAGLRSFVADRTPVVGEEKEAENFFWLVGQGGYGFQTAPALARCCKAAVTRSDFPQDLIKLGVDKDGLSPDRVSLERG